MKRESVFQAELKKELSTLFPGCTILKNDSGQLQGIPDLIILYKDRWAMLECKASAKAPRRPNQEHYVKEFGEMSYASFIYPENKEEVLRELRKALWV